MLVALIGEPELMGLKVGCQMEYEWDLFISHASEDKDSVVRGLASRLRDEGLAVWYDEFSLVLGDSLRAAIDRGLRDSRLGVVILSPSFFQKRWPQNELDGLLAKEQFDQYAILPVWHNVTAAAIAEYSPVLAGRVAVPSTNIDIVVDRILGALNRAKLSELHLEPLNKTLAVSSLTEVVSSRSIAGAVMLGLLHVNESNTIELSEAFKVALIRSARDTVANFEGRFSRDWSDFVVRAALEAAGSTDERNFVKVVEEIVGPVGLWLIDPMGIDLRLTVRSGGNHVGIVDSLFEMWQDAHHLVMDNRSYRSNRKVYQELMRICRQVVEVYLALEWPASTSIKQMTDIGAVILYLDLHIRGIDIVVGDFYGPKKRHSESQRSLSSPAE